MFNIEKKTLCSNGRIDTIKIINQKNGCTIEILKGFGAALNRFDYKDMSFVEGYESEAELAATFADRSSGAILFPFPNRLDAGQYSFKGKSYQLPLNFSYQPHAIHGLLVAQPFELISEQCGEDIASVVLAFDYDRLESGYPFKFRVEITWSLNANNEAACETKVINRDTQCFPYSIGWHPYFTLNKQNVKNYLLSFPSEHRVICDELDLPTGEFIEDREFNQGAFIEDRFLNSCWRLTANTAQAEITMRSKDCPISLSLKQDYGMGLYQHFQAYTPPSRTSVALEPMTCIANVFNNKHQLLVLDAKEEVSMSWRVSLLETC